MIPFKSKTQSMLNRNKLSLAILLLLCSIWVNGKTPSVLSPNDTIFVYETVTLYDTIYVHDTIRVIEDLKVEPINSKETELFLLQIDSTSMQANLLIVSKERTATLPINSIILNENIQNLKSMKKISFLGVVLFAFQSMVMAQTNYGITAGVGTWWAKCSEPSVGTEYSPTLKTGVYVEHAVGESFFLKTELNYHFLNSNYSYKTYIYNDYFGDSEAASNYHQFSIPLQVGFSFGRVKPYLGVEYSYRISESWLNTQINSFGVLGGLNYSISDNLSFSLNYHNGLTKDLEYSGTILNPATKEKIKDYNFYWKSSSIELALYYRLKNKKNKLNP